MQSKHVVVVGGSVAGLGTALALAQAGHRVTVLEQDATPLPATAVEAFEKWDRRGSPQTRHSHALLARLHNLIRDRAPEFLAELVANGAEPMPFSQFAEKLFDAPDLTPEDGEITMLACRRITFEWVLRRHVTALPGVTLRDGVSVQALLGELDDSGRPRVRGVSLASETGSDETLDADLVVDASGRRSKASHWLEALGAAPLREDSEPCGIFYSSRFYRLREGEEAPVLEGPMGADLGYLKYGIFPGDSRIFSITLCASPDDAAMRGILREETFERIAARMPTLRDWVAPDCSEPVSEVHGMGNLKNTRRHWVEDGEPIALGLVAVGDALMHTNPLYGRGCSLAWVNAFHLADAFAEHGDDLRAFALDLDARVERDIVPWYLSARTQDRDATEVSAQVLAGEDPFDYDNPDGTVNAKAYLRCVFREGFLPALRQDLGVMRTFMRLFNLLEDPADLMKNPAVMQKVLAAWNTRSEREPLDLGPPRDELIAYLESQAA
ncbi:MAG: FAD-dependent oxidoreductase [Proteobacteria bacterium]|nr:FAD-dependent oxidoreductase [Pseudomonadota bacterium]